MNARSVEEAPPPTLPSAYAPCVVRHSSVQRALRIVCSRSALLLEVNTGGRVLRPGASCAARRAVCMCRELLARRGSGLSTTFVRHAPMGLFPLVLQGTRNTSTVGVGFTHGGGGGIFCVLRDPCAIRLQSAACLRTHMIQQTRMCTTAVKSRSFPGTRVCSNGRDVSLVSARVGLA